MLTFFRESFWGIGALGGISAIILLFLLVHTGKSVWMAAAGIAGILTVFLLLVEIRTVTDKEAIAATLQEIAADLESNNHPEILRHVSPSSPELRKHIERLLPRISFQRAKVKSNLSVEPIKDSHPPRISARFNAVLIASDRKAGLENQFAPFLFVVEFERHDKDWQVTHYEQHDPRGEAFDDHRNRAYQAPGKGGGR